MRGDEWKAWPQIISSYVKRRTVTCWEGVARWCYRHCIEAVAADIGGGPVAAGCRMVREVRVSVTARSVPSMAHLVPGVVGPAPVRQRRQPAQQHEKIGSTMVAVYEAPTPEPKQVASLQQQSLGITKMFCDKGGTWWYSLVNGGWAICPDNLQPASSTQPAFKRPRVTGQIPAMPHHVHCHCGDCASTSLVGGGTTLVVPAVTAREEGDQARQRRSEGKHPYIDQWPATQQPVAPGHHTKLAFLLCGQSNMVGRAGVPTPAEPESPSIWAVTARGQWKRASEPITPHDGRGRGKGYGPGTTFARTILKELGKCPCCGEPPAICLIPCAVGAVTLSAPPRRVPTIQAASPTPPVLQQPAATGKSDTDKLR
jgi:hypothetical protein